MSNFNRVPFGRAISMMAAISAALSTGDIAARHFALQAIEPYRSRGKGGRYRNWSTSGKKSGNKCNSCGATRSCAGEGETARRRRQIGRMILTRSNGLSIA